MARRIAAAGQGTDHVAHQPEAIHRSLQLEERFVVGIAAGVAATIVGAVMLGLNVLNYDVVVGILTVLVLGLVTAPLLRRAARLDRDPGILRVLMWSLALKAAFTLVRYFVITVVYGDNGDAGVYSGGGTILMDMYRHGKFVLEAPQLANRGAETNRIAVVVGLIYLITGVSRYAASFVFSWFCFVGQLLMYRAFRTGVPDGDSHRYALLVFLLPSMLFWPSSIGKEALMVLAVGIASYGAAQILGTRVRASGIGIFLLGVAGLFFIRPHMSLIAIVSLACAGLVTVVTGFTEEHDKRASAKPFLIRVVALVILVGAAGIATTQVSRVLGGDDESGLTGVLDKTRGQTAEGGSEFVPADVTSPIHFPSAAVTVLVRPFPWEARSVNSAIASGEGVLLASLLVVSRRRLLAWVKALPRRPYLVYCLAFTLTFIVAFSFIANFGILARQRTQMFPLMLTTLAIPAATERRGSAR